MTKQELIEALEPFDEDIQICIFKNGTIFCADAFYHTTNKDYEAVIVLHNFKPDLPKIVGLK